MAEEQEGFEVCYNHTMGDWFIVHRQMKGDVLHRNILADRFKTQEDALQTVEKLEG